MKYLSDVEGDNSHSGCWKCLNDGFTTSQIKSLEKRNKVGAEDSKIVDEPGKVGDDS